MSNERPDIICGKSWMQCSECGYLSEVGKGKYSIFDNVINEPIVLCEACINKILKEAENESN